MKTPLLPSSSSAAAAVVDSGAAASLSSAVFNLSTSIIGAGIMSIPATMKVLGVGPALLLLAAVAFLSDSSVEFMMRYTEHGVTSSSYAALMAESFGAAGSTALQLCVILTNAGALVMYLIIIGDVISGNGTEVGSAAGLLQEWFGEQWWTARSVALLATLLLVLLPLVMLRRVDSLRFTSAISVFLAVVFVFISSGMALYALFNGTAKPPRLLPDFSRQSVLELFTAVPVIVVAFTFHFNIHPIRAELAKISDMKVAVRISLFLCSVIYSTVGFFGYLLFGDSTMSDILSNFNHESSSSKLGGAINDIVRLSYALHLVLVFPLLNFSLRLNIDELLFSKRRPLASDTVRFTSLTALLMAFVYGATIAIPNIWVLFQFMGSTTAVCLSLIFPGAIVLRDIHGISKRRDKALAAVMITMAVITSTIAIATNINNLFNTEQTKGPLG